MMETLTMYEGSTKYLGFVWK